MKRLLQINIEVNYGSTGRIAEEIGQMAIASGWESYIAYGRQENSSASKLIKVGNTFDTYWHVLQTRLLDRHALASVKATKRLVAQIENIKPSIIHLHNIHGYYINIEILFSYLSKSDIPVVWSLHDCWAMTGHCTHFELVGCEKWKTECHDCPQIQSYPTSLFRDRSTKNHILKKKLFTDQPNLTLVPVSHWLGDLVDESFLTKHDKRVIQNGIDTELFSPKLDLSFRKKHNVLDKFLILGVASVWTKIKGWDDLLAISKELADDEVIVMVGLNEKQLKSLPANIIGLQRTRNIQELIELYTTSDVFVNLTYADTFPTTNLEALSCGTPIITYRTGGSIESVTPETGLIIEQGSLTELLKALRTIKKNGKEHYTASCVRNAKQMFNKNDKYKEYLELYDELIVSNSPA